MEEFFIEVQKDDSARPDCYQLDLTFNGDVLIQRVIVSALTKQALWYEANALLQQIITTEGYLSREVLMKRVVDEVDESCHA